MSPIKYPNTSSSILSTSPPSDSPNSTQPQPNGLSFPQIQSLSTIQLRKRLPAASSGQSLLPLSRIGPLIIPMLVGSSEVFRRQRLIWTWSSGDGVCRSRVRNEEDWCKIWLMQGKVRNWCLFGTPGARWGLPWTSWSHWGHLDSCFPSLRTIWTRHPPPSSWRGLRIG